MFSCGSMFLEMALKRRFKYPKQTFGRERVDWPPPGQGAGGACRGHATIGNIVIRTRPLLALILQKGTRGPSLAATLEILSFGWLSRADTMGGSWLLSVGCISTYYYIIPPRYLATLSAAH